MSGNGARGIVDRTIERLRAGIENPQALVIGSAARDALRGALRRVEEQLQGEPEPVLTIALVGCSGSGKSTLLNALAGTVLAEVSTKRPCTRKPMVYHHRDFPQTALSASLASEVVAVTHDRAELRQKQLVDTPDLDSFKTEHRALTQALLKATGLVLYVFTPERYMEESAWSVIRAEQRFSACVAVLNKCDKETPETITKIAESIRRKFTDIGCPDIRLFRTCAKRHTMTADSEPASTPQPGELDELLALQQYIEQELTSGDVTRLIQRQRAAAIESLSAEVERVAPANLGERLERLSIQVEADSDRLAAKLLAELDGRLMSMEVDMKPLSTMRQHQTFFGPLRLWLAASDFLLYGGPTLVRRLRWGSTPKAGSSADATFFADKLQKVDELLRGFSYVIQDACAKAGLPVGALDALRSRISGAEFLNELARRVAARFESAVSLSSTRLRITAKLASSLGFFIPLGLCAFAAYLMVQGLLHHYAGGGPRLLEWVTVLTLFLCVLLHGAVSVLLAGGSPAYGIGQEILHELTRQTAKDHVVSYRAAVEADVAALREPLAALREACKP